MPADIEKGSLAEGFRDCIQKTLEEHCSVIFTKDAKVEQLDIIEYDSRLRVFGLEKFNDTCNIGVINMYGNAEDQKQKRSCGCIIIYVKEESAERLFKSLLKGLEGEDEELIMECVRGLCQRVFNNFKRKATQFGYQNLLSGEPEMYLSNVEEGVAFPYDEDTLYQVSCTLWREKVFVAELVLAPAKNG